MILYTVNILFYNIWWIRGYVVVPFITHYASRVRDVVYIYLVDPGRFQIQLWLVAKLRLNDAWTISIAMSVVDLLYCYNKSIVKVRNLGSINTNSFLPRKLHFISMSLEKLEVKSYHPVLFSFNGPKKSRHICGRQVIFSVASLDLVAVENACLIRVTYLEFEVLPFD